PVVIDNSTLNSSRGFKKDLSNKEFTKKWEQLQSELHWIELSSNCDANVENIKTLHEVLTNSRKNSPSKDPQQRIQEINKCKEDCIVTIGILNSCLDQIQFFLDDRMKVSRSIIEKRVGDMINRVIEFYTEARQNSHQVKPAAQKIQKIFDLLAFTDIKTLLNNLKTTDIRHTLDKNSCCLKSFCAQVVESLANPPELNLEEKIEEIVQGANDRLCFSYVKEVIFQKLITKSQSRQAKENLCSNLKLLMPLYLTGLMPEQAPLKLAWENLNRKVEGQRLSAKKINQVRSWLTQKGEQPRRNKQQQHVENELMSYFVTGKQFDLKDVPEAEHNDKKEQLFNNFLEEKCFPCLTFLRDKKESLLSYFRIAHKIPPTQNMAARFQKKIETLGEEFSHLFDLENNSTSIETKLSYLSAEYELQDIGELALKLTARPQCWRGRDHILSSQHLSWLGIMRKMMAHYPLMLSRRIMQWNLEYLAFDTRFQLSPQNALAYPFEPLGKVQRRSISFVELSDKKIDLQNHLMRLNLHTLPDVLYPSLSMTYLDYLHPFGDLTLMVKPTDQIESPRQFRHALMELELILSQELDA
ncbi:MAG: hypothetical protein ACHQUC_10865, partial [Chlamydiales bacterium]